MAGPCLVDVQKLGIQLKTVVETIGKFAKCKRIHDVYCICIVNQFTSCVCSSLYSFIHSQVQTVTETQQIHPEQLRNVHRRQNEKKCFFVAS